MTLQERVWQRRNRLRNRFSSLASSELQESPATAPAPRRKATLADVAERAGVSTSTASRALNGHAGLAPATRAAVEDAAAILNFQPSALARSLRTQQTFTVGFVVPDVSSPFYAAALKGAQGRLEQAGYRVMLMDANQDVERELAAVETLLSHQVDGLLVASAGMPRAALREHGFAPNTCDLLRRRHRGRRRRRGDARQRARDRAARGASRRARARADRLARRIAAGERGGCASAGLLRGDGGARRDSRRSAT